jgi:hypothetical protein
MHRPIVAPLAELARAVEWIDDPDPPFRTAKPVIGGLFGQDEVVWPCLS